MRHQAKYLLSCLSLTPLLFAALQATDARAETLRAQNLGGEILLVETAEGPVVERPVDEGAGAEGPAVRRVALPNAAFTDLQARGELWWAAGVEKRGDGALGLVLVAGRGERAENLAVPATPGPRVLDPVLLAGESGPRTLAWLEGVAHDRLAVKASRLQDGTWSEPIDVSPPGPGSQLALTAAELEGGDWLLAWAAFDGRDDEILWSRLSGGVWSEPAAAARGNSVPDITPALAAVPGGALLVWSRYDGNDYRLELARFDGEGFSRPRTIGPKSSLMPSFQKKGGTALLVYRTAVPERTWTVDELDPRGKVLRRASSTEPRPERPLVTAVDEKGIELAWPGLPAVKAARASWVE